MSFQADNPLTRISLTLSDLCCIHSVKGPAEVRPEHEPLLTGVEAVRDRNAPANLPQTASRYFLVFPGSQFMRVAVKVDETAPSITQEVIEKYGGVIRVKIEGFSSGVFEVDGGGARPYFKASRITPISAQTTQK